MTPQSHLVKSAHVDTRPFHQELVVLDLRAGEYFALDELGTRVWLELGRGRGLGEIVVTLAAEYEADPARIAADVFAFAEELIRRGLVLERD